MTKALVTFLLLGIVNVFAGENSYVLKYSVSKKNLVLKIKTTESFNPSCELAVVGIKIVRAVGFGPGDIDLEIAPTEKCVDVEAPHSLIFEIPRGSTLPQIPDGFYQIYINGEFYQTIDSFPGRGSETGNG